MSLAYFTIAALAVVAIYYVWRCYFRVAFLREQILRRRVAYMLLTMASSDALGLSQAGSGWGEGDCEWETDLGMTPAPRG